MTTLIKNIACVVSMLYICYIYVDKSLASAVPLLRPCSKHTLRTRNNKDNHKTRPVTLSAYSTL